MQTQYYLNETEVFTWVPMTDSDNGSEALAEPCTQQELIDYIKGVDGFVGNITVKEQIETHPFDWAVSATFKVLNGEEEATGLDEGDEYTMYFRSIRDES